MVDMTKHRTPDSMVLAICIPSIEAVKDFVSKASDFFCTAIIESERYAIDAKSIMGVFSLDVTKPLVLILEKPEKNKTDDRIAFTEAIKPYIVRRIKN